MIVAFNTKPFIGQTLLRTQVHLIGPWLDSGSPRCVTGVRQRQQSGAQVVKRSQHGKAVAKRMAAFDAQQTGDTAVVVRFLDPWNIDLLLN